MPLVWVSDREEVNAARIRRNLGGGRPGEIPWLDGLACDVGDIAAAHADVREFARRKAAQLGHGFPVAAPVAVVADHVHDISRFVFGSMSFSLFTRTKIGVAAGD